MTDEVFFRISDHSKKAKFSKIVDGFIRKIKSLFIKY